MKRRGRKQRENFTVNFIRYYKLLPALWNKNHASFNDIEARRKSHALLLYKHKETYPRATLRDMMMEINSLRASFLVNYIPGSEERSWVNEMAFIKCDEPVEEEVNVEEEFGKLEEKIGKERIEMEFEKFDPETDLFDEVLLFFTQLIFYIILMLRL